MGEIPLPKEIQGKWPQKAIYNDLEIPSDFNKLTDSGIYLSDYMDNFVNYVDTIGKFFLSIPLCKGGDDFPMYHIRGMARINRAFPAACRTNVIGR